MTVLDQPKAVYHLSTLNLNMKINSFFFSEKMIDCISFFLKYLVVADLLHVKM